MPSRAPILLEHLPAFHKEAGVVFQFLLNEWLLASKCNFELSCQLDKLLEKPASKRVFQDLNREVKKLSGIPSHFISYMTQGHEGILKKLSGLAHIIAGGTHDEKSEERALRKSANLALEHALELEYLTATTPDNLISLKNQGEKITLELQRIGKTLSKLLCNYTNDENVLFFLVRHKKDFDSILGMGFVKKLIAKNYPEGLAEAENFLISRYTKRGFNEMASLIKMLMQDLKK